MSEIVLGYDGSRCAEAALSQGIQLAKELGDKLVLVFGYAPGGYGGGEVPTHREAVKEFGEKVIEAAAKAAAAAGVDHEVELVPEKAANALATVAAKRGARMIVVGSYGEKPITGAILGTTPHKLLHLSEVPVLVVAAPE